MISTFFSHSLKQFSRSSAFAKDLSVQIFLSFIFLVAGGYALALGFNLEMIITKILKRDAISFLNGTLVYYFLFEFLTRYFLQKTPSLDARPYLHLPISRKYIASFILGKSLTTPINIFIWLLFAPFAFTRVVDEFGSAAAWNWILSLTAISGCVHFAVVLFKKKWDDSIWGIWVIVGLVALGSAADYLEWFNLTEFSSIFFRHVYSGSGLIISLICFASICFITFRVFRHGFYLDEAGEANAHSFQSVGWTFLHRFGHVGEWVSIEVKLIFRNKRTRSAVLVCGLFLLYGLIFYTKDKYLAMPGLLLFVGIFTTGIFMINYGQFLFSWQGSHYDFILTRPVTMKQFVESKYWLLTSVSIVCFLLSIPYLYFGWMILLLNFAALLFNLGINIFIIMNMAMWGAKKIDLSKSSMMNYEGIGAAQWILGIPILLSPYVIYLPFSLLTGQPVYGLLVLAAVGVIGLILRRQLVDLTTRRLLEKKYSMSENFRK